MITKKLFSTQPLRVDIVNKKHLDLIRDPVFNKGHAFSREERDRLGLKGLLGYQMFNIQTQIKLNKELLKEGWEIRVVKLNDEIIQSGVHPDSIRKWNVLQNIQDNDETLFYRMVMNNFMEMAPIIYTPTVGWACMNFSQLLSRPRGMVFSAPFKGELASMVYNWPESEVDAIVVTDGSRVLGLGDQGIGGLQIAVGKLDLYVAGAGFNPRRVLPVCLDVGTSNQRLLDDENYLGVKAPRLEGEEYYEFVDEFIQAVRSRYPKVLIQFEDFQLKHAMTLLKRYRDQEQILCFNDDIQGTAATILAGLKGAMKVSKKHGKDLCKQKYVVCGAGSAGSGAIMTIFNTLVERYGMDPKDAAKTFYVLDKDGLISKNRKNLQDLKINFEEIEQFAQDDLEMEGMDLQTVIETIHPTVLIGLSAVKNLFNENIVKTMHKYCSSPIIFALSNPTSRSELSAINAQTWTNGQCIFASGSPYGDVEINGRKIKSAQCNNSYIFPGLALGASMCQPKIVTDQMFRVAAEALTEYITEEDIQLQSCFPKLDNIRQFSSHLAARVIAFSCDQNLATNKECIKRHQEGFDSLKSYVQEQMWQPDYRNLIFQQK